MTSNFNSKGKNVTVVVLGDFGRSPRMQYHALSLVKNNYLVDVVAYKGSEPLQQIIKHDKIHLHYVKETPNFIKIFPQIFQYVLKTLWQSLFLLITLLQVKKIDCIFLQNPPSIPTLPICWFISFIRSCSLFVDFHNYGYTIMSLSAGRKSLLVRIAEWCEKYFSRKSNRNICVTKAMKEDLCHNWNVSASVFYDCAPDIFHAIDIEDKHSFFMKISKDYKQFQPIHSVCDGEECTRFTRKDQNGLNLLPKRPALVVSSTSWTEDEDFSVLLAALEDYEHCVTEKGDLPDLIVAITGKGPLKTYYEKLIEGKDFMHVQIITLWLQFEDYPTFLACADLGVSLHSSSSGLDLPMKVVDMFGCCLPVTALSFGCIDELVNDGINGKVFSSSMELSRQFQELFSGFPNRRTELNTFRDNLLATTSLRWEENWNHTVAPLFVEMQAASRQNS